MSVMLYMLPQWLWHVGQRKSVLNYSLQELLAQLWTPKS